MRLFSWVCLQSPIQHKCSVILKKIIPKSLILPIIEGPLKGKRWVVNSSNLAYFLGNFENHEMACIRNLLRPGDIFFDIGANVGIYTLFASDIVGETGRVFAFEPLPNNVYYLKKHILINNCTNVEICECAISNESGRCNFFEHSDNTMGYLSKEGTVLVVTKTLDEIIDNNNAIVPNLIKIDVEGSESSVLQGSIQLFSKYNIKCVISLHSAQERKKCIEILTDLGYATCPIDCKDITLTTDILAYKK